MIQHFLEERFHKAVRFFGDLVAKDVTIKGDLTINGDLTVDEGFKEYVCSLTQSGTSAPSVKVIKNTLGGDIVWTRGVAGTYVGTLTGAFVNGKTQLFAPEFDANFLATDNSYSLLRASANAVNLRTYFEGALADNLLDDSQVISIRVWN